MMILEKKPTKKQPIGLPKANLKSKFLRSPQLLWSGSAGIVAYDCISSSIGSVNSPGSSGAISLVGVQGLGMRFGTVAGGDSLGALIWTGRPTTTTTKYTLAAHFVTSTSNSSQILVSSSGDNSGFRLTVNSTGTSLLFTKGGIVDITTIGISTGIEYFVIASHDETTNEYYVILKNLQNNSISITTGTDTGTATAGNGKFQIGNFTDFAPRSFNGLIYSAYIGFDFLPLPLGIEWSNDSWSHFDTAYTFEKLHTNKTHYYVKQDFTRQPIGATAKKLIQNKYHLNPQFAWIGSSVTAYDSFLGQFGVVSGGFTQVTGPGGIGLTFGNTTTRGLSFPGKDNAARPRYTMAAHFRPKASGTYQVLIASSSSGNNGFMIQVDSSGTSVILVKPAVEAVNSLSVTVDRDYFVIMSHDEGTDAYWLILKDLQSGATTSVSGTTTSAAAGPDGTYVVGNMIGTDRSFNGYIYSAYMGFEFTPFALGLEIANNSWKLFGSSTIYTIRDGDDPIVAVNYDLTIDPSTYVLTNSNISFFSDRFINLTANSYSLTNSNISLSLNKFISLDSNNYLLTNNNITLLTDKVLSVNETAYSLTNNNISFYSDRLLTILPNTYTLTNSDINLYADKVLTLSSNTYTLTNLDISYSINRVISVDSNTYTLTNSNINLLINKLISFDPNTYALTNSNISYSINRLISFDPNTYILTNSNINLINDKLLVVTPNTYTLVNFDIMYETGKIFYIDPVVYTLTNTNINLLNDKLLVVTPNTYTLVNFDIFYDLGKVFSIDPSAYNLVNTGLNFSTQRLLNISNDTLSISSFDLSLLSNRLLSVDSYSYDLLNSNLYHYHNKLINIAPSDVNIVSSTVDYSYNRVLNINSITYTSILNDMYFSITAILNTGNILGTYITDKYIPRIMLDKYTAKIILDNSNIRFISQ